ncbi:MAG: SiaB family protein kinase [Cytophagaceae bacterium]
MIDLLEQYERMHDNNIMLSFKGEVTFDLVNSILKIIEERLNKTEEDLKTKKKVYNVLVECLQNLCHHIEESATEENFGTKTAILMIYMNDSTYHVLTGNYIYNKNIDHIRNWLDQINSVSKDELRELYKKILNNEQFSEKGGGGLGFIDIARKSGQKLNYNFKPVNDNVSFFSFQINIPKQEV